MVWSSLGNNFWEGFLYREEKYLREKHITNRATKICLLLKVRISEETSLSHYNGAKVFILALFPLPEFKILLQLSDLLSAHRKQWLKYLVNSVTVLKTTGKNLSCIYVGKFFYR